MDTKQFIQKHEGTLFEALADYKKWFEGGEEHKDRLKTINETITDLDEALKDSYESYPVMFLCKDDLLAEFRDDEKAQMIIKNLTDEQMKELMSKINDSLCSSNDIWLHLKINFEELFLKC